MDIVWEEAWKLHLDVILGLIVYISVMYLTNADLFAFIYVFLIVIYQKRK